MMNRVITISICTIALALAPSTSPGAEAAPSRELAALRDGYERAIAPSVRKAEQEYIQRLDTQMRQLGGAGRIAEAAVVKAEITRVLNREPSKADGGKIPEPLATLRRNYESGLATALRPMRQSYAQKLEALVRQLGAAARIDDAARAQKELDAIRKTASLEAPAVGFSTTWKRPDKAMARAMIARGEITAISSRSAVGHAIGHLPPRSVVVLQYVEGKWKDRGNVPSESPDDPKSPGGEDVRLALVNMPLKGKAQTIFVVPPDTKEEPFVFVADRNLENAVLRINDTDGDFPKNPDAGVKYRLFVQRP